jgi:hypothetical protein
MMRKAVLSICAAAGTASFAAAPAPAQANTSVASAFEAGRCIVERDRRAAVALIRSLPLDSSPANLSSLGDRAGGCVSGPISALVLRGAIAQELFLRDFRSFGREPRDPDRLVNLNLPVEEFGARGSGATQLYRWSDCVVRNDTANTERLLRSPVGSAAEASALEALQTYMSACFTQGAQLSVRSSEVRSLFAQSAYYSMYRYWTGQLQSARGGNGA